MSKSNLAWESVNWQLVTNRVLKIQRRIYKAANGPKSRVHWLQKHLINSLDAKLLAVWLVTARDKSKQTPEVNRQKIPAIVVPSPGKAKDVAMSSLLPAKAARIRAGKVLSDVAKDVGFAREYTLYTKCTPSEKSIMAQNLSLNGKARSTKRFWISKPGKSCQPQTPLSGALLDVSTIQDRAKQTLAKLALEPEWEAIFEPNSYGSRPGRSPHDAIEAIFNALHHNIPKWVFNADIKKCFDKIDHSYLLSKLNTFPQMEKQIGAWLKAGIVEEYVNIPKTSEETWVDGVPEIKKGIIFPLLSNIALHGLEYHLKEYISDLSFKPSPTVNSGRRAKASSLTIVRHADHFVIIHAQQEILNLCIEETRKWLCKIGLKLSKEEPPTSTFSPSSTPDRGGRTAFAGTERAPNGGSERNASTGTSRTIAPNRGRLRTGRSVPLRLPKVDVGVVRDCRESFNFLGFTVSLVRKNTGRYNVKIVPSRESRLGFVNNVRNIIKKNRSISTYELINKLRPVVIDWGNYFKFCECTVVFTKQSNLLFQMLRHWVFRRHPQEGRTLVKEKYWPSGRTYYFDGAKHQDNWVLCGKTLVKSHVMENYLPQMYWIHSRKFVKIQGTKSPFDSDYPYWATRNGKYSAYSLQVPKLYKAQDGVCPLCKKYFDTFSKLEVDHIVPRVLGGKDQYSNLQLLHKDCHLKKTIADMLSIRSSKASFK